MKSKIKILFLGTPNFAAIVLEKMIEGGYIPTMVITAPDKPVGRKQVLTTSPVKVLAEKNKIPVSQPAKILDSKFYILNSKPNLIVLAAYGQIIPKEILEIPKFGCLNVHPSLLPKYRGASPIQATILNGDQETGVTIMLMDEKFDSGPIIQNKKLNLKNKKPTYPELTEELANFGAELLIETLPKWINGEIKAIPQDDKKATFTKIINKEDGKIDWQKSAEEIERMTRAFNPWPTTYTEFRIKNIEYRKLKIIKASVLKTENKKEPGMVFLIPSTGSVSIQSEAEGLTPDKIIAVACGKNALILEQLQLEGKKIMTAREFLNGHQEIIGQILK